MTGYDLVYHMHLHYILLPSANIDRIANSEFLIYFCNNHCESITHKESQKCKMQKTFLPEWIKLEIPQNRNKRGRNLFEPIWKNKKKNTYQNQLIKPTHKCLVSKIRSIPVASKCTKMHLWCTSAPPLSLMC